MNNKKRIIIIGGGAAGFFGAISVATHYPDAEVVILEKNRTVLNKVRISGGGRCNVTHACFDDKILSKFYPRGGSFLRPLFKQFNAQSTIEWFEQQGVMLKTEADGRMFPTTDSSDTIIDCLLKVVRQKNIQVRTSEGVKAISKTEKWQIQLLSDKMIEADAILITSGGNPQLTGYQWLTDLGITIIPPVPSLFTFNAPNSPCFPLAGVAVPNATVRIAGKKLSQSGALLITHWGFSGPAVLKLSAWAARELAETNYQFTLLINWLGDVSENNLREDLQFFKEKNPKKQITSNPIFNLPSRLWKLLTELAEIKDELRWIDISPKQFNKLVENLINFPQKVNGKSTFKEEFVTAGGVDLHEINPETLESKQHKGLFFAGEVLDIDAVTGGFNFQAAWTTGFVAGFLGERG